MCGRGGAVCAAHSECVDVVSVHVEERSGMRDSKRVCGVCECGRGGAVCAAQSECVVPVRVGEGELYVRLIANV